MTVCVVFGALTALIVLTPCVRAADVPPPWAWGFPGPMTEPPPPFIPAKDRPNPAATRDNKTLHRVGGSKFTFTQAQVGDPYGPADWFPDAHPPMPQIVAHGRASPDQPIWACGLCHLPTGRGRPENANVTGLPPEYFIQQLKDFRNGDRQTSDPRKTNSSLMIGFAKAMTDEDMRTAAAYFAAIPQIRWVKVVESAQAPKVEGNNGLFLPLKGDKAGLEPLGRRIVETSTDEENSEMWRNTRTGFIAYVPPGSVKRGERLVTTGDGKTTACTVCHGVDLRGLGPIPRLAGRSPSYLARQLYDFQHGNRVGAWSQLMAPIVGDLDDDDILNTVAYLASLDP